MKNILIIIGVLITILGIATLFKSDQYVGFYYPDANDLLNDIQSQQTFDSLDLCRDWIDEQVSIYNPDDSEYDYECGKNCDLSGGKPYICEETSE
ncbi:MAG: hypothetical protein A2114_00205 [Candidatus Vogelbacteria bacterium GWA1_51_14]|uniref:Uncharacterized protein n=1 Tax=Candidatus Vogelbacteria bacterium GWA1_51_14 TaxID=1802435 RepID=A0A1G2Q8V3_9BACT|nr:MAG: hypothetical protein A2114_00205 [Candidatus Vogelbacteria bacterium GWA1_51_14]